MNRYYLVKEDGTKIENPKINGLTVEFLGNDSLVEISEGSVFENTKLSLASESKIIIKKQVSTAYVILGLMPVPEVLCEIYLLMKGLNL